MKQKTDRELVSALSDACWREGYAAAQDDVQSSDGLSWMRCKIRKEINQYETELLDRLTKTRATLDKLRAEIADLKHERNQEKAILF